MNTTTYTETPPGAAPTADLPAAAALIDSLSRRDFPALATCFAADVRMRAVLPQAELDLHSAEQATATFARWFGGVDGFEVLDTSARMIGSRQYLRWRIRMWPPDRPDQSRVVEQHAFTRGTDRVESLDLLCSGFHAEHTDGAR